MIELAVDGMVIRNGFLWMQCPEDIRASLEEIEGVNKVHFDMRKRVFAVDVDPSVTPTEIQQAVESAGEYTVSRLAQV